MHKSGTLSPLDKSRKAKVLRRDTSWIAIQGLRFLADNRRAAERFFAWSGLDGASIRAAAEAPGFATALLDFLRQDEELLLRFCAEAGEDPAELAALADGLTAGETWTDAEG